MFLKEKSNDDLVEVLSMMYLYDTFCSSLVGRYQHGEEPQDPETFNKTALAFPSGEELPRCWLDAHYRDSEIQR